MIIIQKLERHIIMRKYLCSLLIIIAPLVFTMASKYISLYTSTNWSLGFARNLFPVLLALIIVILDYSAVVIRTGSKKEGVCILAIGIVQLLVPFLVFSPAMAIITYLNIYNTSTLITYYVHALFAIILGISEVRENKV